MVDRGLPRRRGGTVSGRRLAIGVTIGVAISCSGGGSRTDHPTPGHGSGSGASGCEAVRAHVERLYRAEAQSREPKRVDQAVADNTAMVLRDCAGAAQTIAPCLRSATTIQGVEGCLPRLDEEGSEGDAFAR